MGLSKCIDCGADVSTMANACPKCGREDPTTSIGQRIFGMFLILALFNGGIYLIAKHLLGIDLFTIFKSFL